MMLLLHAILAIAASSRIVEEPASGGDGVGRVRRTRSRGRRWDVLRKLAKDRDGWRCQCRGCALWGMR